MSAKIITLAILLLSCALILIAFANNGNEEQVSSAVFTGDEDHSISLEEAALLTLNYRQDRNSNPKLGGVFGEQAIQKILDQEGIVGLRYYYGVENDGTPVLILTGVDKEWNDFYNGLLAERSMPCPPCGTDNILNGQLNEEMALNNF